MADGVGAPPAAPGADDTGWCEARRNARLGEALPPLPFDCFLEPALRIVFEGFAHETSRVIRLGWFVIGRPPAS